MPFGEDLLGGVGARDSALKYNSADDDVRQKFTGYQKDEETQLDFAEARMYENRHARFTAVDPLLASGKSANPQTFNRFVYCSNNPIACTDPSGLDGIWTYKTHSNGGIEYKHFDSEDAMREYNSHHNTEFCQQNQDICVDYQVWNRGNFGLYYDRTGVRLNDDGTQTPFSLQGYWTDEQWLDLVRDWYAGKDFNEGAIKVFNAAIRDQATTGVEDGYNGTFGRTFTGGTLKKDFNDLMNSPEAKAFPSFSALRPLNLSRPGVSMFGKAFERRYLSRHLPNTAQSNKLARKNAAHVFNDIETLSNVESTIFANGTYNGFIRGYHRYTFRFDKPIGIRIQNGNTDLPLYFGEIKIRPNGFYHLAPRPKPATP